MAGKGAEYPMGKEPLSSRREDPADDLGGRTRLSAVARGENRRKPLDGVLNTRTRGVGVRRDASVARRYDDVELVPAA